MVAQELDCTECRGKFSFSMSFERDGNYRIVCPHCAHEHFRMVRDGRITGDRWASSSMPWDRVMAEKVAASPKPRRPRRARTVRQPGTPPPVQTVVYSGRTPLYLGGNTTVIGNTSITGNLGYVSASTTAANTTVWSTSGATTNTTSII